MSKFKRIILELARTAFQYPETGELTELVEKSEDQLDDNKILSILSKLVTDKISAVGQNMQNEGYKAAERKLRTQFEEDVKKVFGITSDLKGEALLNHVKETLSTSADDPGKKGKMTDDDIKKSAVFLKMEESFNEQIKKLKTDFEKEKTDWESKQTREANFQRFKDYTKTKWADMGILFSDDPELAKNQMEGLFKLQFEGYEFEFPEGVTKPVVTKDGKRVEDQYKNVIDTDAWIEKLTTVYFPKKVGEQRQNPFGDNNQRPGDTPPNGDAKKFKGKLPTNLDEFDILMSDPKLPIDQKKEVQAHWEKVSTQPAAK